MTDTPEQSLGNESLSDGDMTTDVPPTEPMPGGDADGTDGDDADGTDGDSSDGDDADGTDGTDGDGSDGSAL